MSPEARDLLACEVALGLAEDADAERLAGRDPAFAALVEAWRSRLAELDETAPPVPAGEALWTRIEAAVGATAASHAPGPTSTPAPRGASAGRPWLAELWENLGFWRGAGLAAAAACLALAVALGASLGRQPAPVLVAVLMTDDNRAAAIVNVGADGRAELVPIAPVDVPAGRVLQVWTLWDRARGPVSVGLSGQPRRVELGLDGLPRTSTDQLFEISLEPAGGSPTGRPTGPVLMKGLAARAL